MATYSISTSFTVPQRMAPGDFPALSDAVRRVSEAAWQQWRSYAQGEPLPDGQVVRTRGNEYAESIQLRQNGTFSATVFSDSPRARDIEEGAPQRDLKEMLNRSLKVRVVEHGPNAGKRYLIIPFRWNTEGKGGVGAGVMPAKVAGWWQGRQPSEVTGWTERKSGTGAWDPRTRAPMMVAQRQYQWGDRLTRRDMDRLGVRGTGARRVMNGMVSFRNPGGSGSTFLTFRTMMEGSSGWIVPAQPGKYVARTVAQQFERIAEAEFRRAIEADIARVLGRL